MNDNMDDNDDQDDNDIPSKKKRRLINQYKEGLEYPPKLTTTIKIMSPSITNWTCNSSSSNNGSDKHTITMTCDPDSNNIMFECNCNFNIKKTCNCKHINSLILKICLSQINNAENSIIEQEKNLQLKHELVNIFDKIKDLNINN